MQVLQDISLGSSQLLSCTTVGSPRANLKMLHHDHEVGSNHVRCYWTGLEMRGLGTEQLVLGRNLELLKMQIFFWFGSEWLLPDRHPALFAI